MAAVVASLVGCDQLDDHHVNTQSQRDIDAQATDAHAPGARTSDAQSSDPTTPIGTPPFEPMRHEQKDAAPNAATPTPPPVKSPPVKPQRAIQTVLGAPITLEDGPIDLYHGLSNGPVHSMALNLGILHQIIAQGVLFPGGRSDGSLECKIYQAAIPTTLKQVDLDSEAFLNSHPEVLKRLEADPELRAQLTRARTIGQWPVVEITTPKLMRTATNYFTSGQRWKSFYTTYITLHWHLNRTNLAELAGGTYGKYVLYGTPGEVVTMPQPLPLRLLTDIIIDGETLPEWQIEKLHRELARHRLGHVNIVQIFGLKSPPVSDDGQLPVPVAELLETGTRVISADEIAKYKIRPTGKSDLRGYSHLHFQVKYLPSKGYELTVTEDGRSAPH